ncbi:FapA family protein [Proteiniclasticum sp. SCR006]|uniref:FapA family protein n=1 Tax=Proteiniclasticum aestuarii TaxID=2817862 RepID=A0A939KHC6_9CLOT|nr:FapA family protein [Proteiniclasticum aestuarii]MBO1265334.1 FapA family protein [Proteiniclasticum aestuarii]
MIFEASTREAAVVMAESYFGCSAESLTVKVIEKPHKKMLGLRKTPGRYEIEVRVENQMLKEKENENGTVEVKNRKILVSNPRSRGSEASLFFNHPQMTLLVNGEEKSGNVTLREEDEIRYTLTDIDPKMHIGVELSEDNLVAYVKIDRVKGKHFFLENQEKTHRASLTIGEENRDCEPVSVEEVRGILLDTGILPEFIMEEPLRKACKEKRSVHIVVARGKAPIRSEASKITYCKEIFVKDILRGLEPVIEKGTLLAEKEADAIQGTPGLDVRGNEIPVLEVKDRDIEATEGAEQDGNRIYASRDGRPYLKNGKVGVVPLLTVVGDLDKDTENIDFDGDVVVKGNVQDNMVIKATGNISIIGSVYHSELLSDQNVEVQGKIIGGRIQAGDENSAFHVLLPLVEKAINITREIFSGLQGGSSQGVHEIMDSIHQGKEKMDGVFHEIDKVRSLFNETQMKTVNELRRSYVHCFKEIKLLHKEGFIELNEIYERLLELVVKIKEEISDERVVKVVYAQSATITSSGDIIITGEGSYQAKLSAGNEIRFERPGNVVKGGTLVAGKFIRAGIIGTPGEIETFCKVMDEEGDITGRYYKGTTLMIRDRIREYRAIE